jgi:exopolysaccharide biosynthesis protein
MDEKPIKKPLPAALLVVCDVVLIGAALCVFALFHHVLPRAYAVEGSGSRAYPASAVAVASAPAAEAAQEQQDGVMCAAAGPAQILESAEVSAAAEPVQITQNQVVSAAAGPAQIRESAEVSAAAAPVQPQQDDTALAEAGRGEDTTGSPGGDESAAAETVESAGLGGGVFAGKFTDGEVITTGNTYMSENVNVTLTQIQRNGVTYYAQDIYIRDIENLRTAFAKNTYGKAILESVPEMAADNNAIAAINGDHYGIGSSGVVIRNGVLYSANPDADVCVLFYDGSMKIVQAADFDADALMAAGAYQAWNFGPSLLSDDGKALGNFRSRVSNRNPRTAIGYYEPGHYVFVVVDGRQAGYSNGMTLAQLAELFEELGAKVAYNLDGGKTSAMTFEGKLANQPTQGGRLTTDIVYIGE